MSRTTPTADPVVTPELIKRHGLTSEEFERIKKILGREPNFTELGIFSVMWSEHCSYKNSRKELRKFPTTGPNILVKAGEENAGVVDIGDGWAVAFKMESHNHPSAIEPFQGAATGVGGIIRDIFTMGARPEFCLNSLRFGPITDENSGSEIRKSKIAANRRLFTGVVSGIAHYGKCVGIPTIGGEIYFDESFEGNPLVNVFCLGVLRHDELARGTAEGSGNPVFYVGAETGRDGLAGAAFASRELTEQSREDRPAVQVGDPFKEKLLLEACLELLARGAIAGEIPAKALAEEAPLYSREARRPTTAGGIGDRRYNKLRKIDTHDALRQLLSDPTIASKNWVSRQYDHTVRTGTVVKPGSDAAVFFVRYANKILAATTDCNSAYCALDPREGGKIAVTEAARNLTCSGAKPLAVTDCLNFGNPYKSENFWQLREAVEGIAEACRAVGTPVTGGNVSLYNENPAGVVDPTPTIAMVGLIDDEKHITTQWFKNHGDVIILVGTVVPRGRDDAGAGINGPGYNLGGSSYLKVCHGLKVGPPPHIDLAHEIKVQNAVRDLIREGLIKSAHDCSEGGLAVALAESCFNPEKLFGAKADCSRRPAGDAQGTMQTNQRHASHSEAATALFNESQSRIIISVAPENLDKAESILRERAVPFQQLGKVEGDQLRIQVEDKKFAWPVADLFDDWWNSIRGVVESDSSAERIPSL